MTSSPEVFCPSCKLKNDASATICAYCNQPLQTEIGDPRTTERMAGGTRTISKGDLKANIRVPKSGVAILHQESGQTIDIEQASQFILGRRTEDQTESPLIDLAPYGAFGLGVSRHHAMILKTETGYVITDLDSTNGTWLESEQLSPNNSYPLTSGAHIRLGRMQIMVVFDESAK